MNERTIYFECSFKTSRIVNSLCVHFVYRKIFKINRTNRSRITLKSRTGFLESRRRWSGKPVRWRSTTQSDRLCWSKTRISAETLLYFGVYQIINVFIRSIDFYYRGEDVGIQWSCLWDMIIGQESSILSRIRSLILRRRFSIGEFDRWQVEESLWEENSA